MRQPLADLLLERGWISEADRIAIDRKIGRKVQKHGGARASLAALAGAKARDAIRRVEHPEIRKSLSSLPPASGHVLVETIVPPRRPEQSRYTLTRMHARGGLGRVWLAHDGDLRREVALKEILPEQAANPETWRRFLKEAQVTGQLEHPNIVPVYELARRREDDQPFYVMRFVRGQSLLDALRDFHRDRAGNAPELLALQGLLAAFLKVCDAVAYAHSRGVVHRDLKPENIVLGAFGEVIVLDWGLAKLVDQPDDPGELGTRSLDRISLADDARTERTQGQMGTPCYMAPEQVDLKHDLVDDRTDVYALGGILFGNPHRTPARRGDDHRRSLRADQGGKNPSGPPARARRSAAPGGHLRQGVSNGPRPPVREREGPGRRSSPLDRRRAGFHLPRPLHRPRPPLGTPQPHRRRQPLRRPAGRCHRPRCRHRPSRPGLTLD